MMMSRQNILNPVYMIMSPMILHFWFRNDSANLMLCKLAMYVRKFTLITPSKDVAIHLQMVTIDIVFNPHCQYNQPF